MLIVHSHVITEKSAASWLLVSIFIQSYINDYSQTNFFQLPWTSSVIFRSQKKVNYFTQRDERNKGVDQSFTSNFVTKECLQSQTIYHEYSSDFFIMKRERERGGGLEQFFHPSPTPSHTIFMSAKLRLSRPFNLKHSSLTSTIETISHVLLNIGNVLTKS